MAVCVIICVGISVVWWVVLCLCVADMMVWWLGGTA